MLPAVRSLASLAFLAVAGIRCGAGQSLDLRGRYDFHSTTAEGTAFTAVVHVTGEPPAYGGMLYTTLRAPFPIDSVAVRDTFLVVFTSRVLLRWPVGAQRFRGNWRIGNDVGVIEGSRHAAEPDNNLRPIPCRQPGVDAVVRCAVLHVPEDRDHPDGRRIPLAIVILPARDSVPAPDPLFPFAGGPGQAATEGAAANTRRFAGLLAHREVVMVDQRGTGGSNGLRCPFPAATDRAQLLFGGAPSADAITRCRTALSARADLHFYHTAIAADDIDAVRAWLGYDRINLYGGSYGTRLGLAYLRQYPERVRTATLRGVLAPGGMLSLDNPRDAQAALEEVFHDCRRQAACAAAFPELEAGFPRLLDRLDREPLPLRVRDRATDDSLDIPVTRGVLGGSIRRMLMDAGLRRRVPLTLAALERGDATPLRAGTEATLAIAGDLFWGMGFSVVCAEDAPRMRRADIGARTRGTFLGRWQVDGMLAICDNWPQGTPPPGYEAPVRAAAPVLLLSGALDPTTPPRWGVETARTLPHARHLVMEGVSHAPFPDCALDVMAAFVERGGLDGLDTSCFAQLTRDPLEVPDDH